MAEPFKKGIEYVCVRWQVVEKVPDLTIALSRTGNASIGIHRVATALQGCKRVHELQRNRGNMDWDQIDKIASFGMGPQYSEDACMYCDFVQARRAVRRL